MVPIYMIEVLDHRVTLLDGKYFAQCACNKTVSFSMKSSAIKMLERGACRNCNRQYQSVNDGEHNIYQNGDRKWCSLCSGCKKEQAYTRKDHAQQSSICDWQCKNCVAQAKGYSNNRPVGEMQRFFNRFQKNAGYRNIEWGLTIDFFKLTFTGKCALTNWDISLMGDRPTASLDRIDSSKPYTEKNTQWVHTAVNMMKNKYDQEYFISMCRAVAHNSSTSGSDIIHTLII